MGTSKELETGIARYESELTALGVGRRVRAMMPNGVVREGVLGEASKCQPTITSDDGRVYMILCPLSQVEVV